MTSDKLMGAHNTIAIARVQSNLNCFDFIELEEIYRFVDGMVSFN